MNHRQNKICGDIESLLVKKITGELLPQERQSLESHLAQCAFCLAQEQELARGWQSFDALPAPEIPAALYEKTRETILGQLRREKSRPPWAERVLGDRIGPVFAAFVAGLVMTGLAYALLHTLVDVRIHHQHMLVALFGSWGLLFAGCFWLVLKGKGKRTLSLDTVAAYSVSIALLTLVISFLAYEVESLRWLAMPAAYEVAVVSNYLFGIGNTFVAGWGIYACLASFLISFIFGVRRGPAFSQNALLGSFLISVLLFPAIYLQGSSHDHGYGILAFAAFGSFVGALVGVGIGSMGSFVLRRILTPAA